MYQIDMKFDRQLRPATDTSRVVSYSYGCKTIPRWQTAAILKFDISPYLSKQELSYRKQLARQVRTQFMEGISVTLKARLRVTQGHWKQNHWVHRRLTISRVIWSWILLWPWNVVQRSLKIIKNNAIWKLGYGFLFAFHSNYGRIFSHFGDIQHQRMI